MIDKELRKEKEELLTELFAKIDNVKKDNDLKDIYDEIKRVNDLLDNHDSKFDNLIDSISDILKPKIKGKIKSKLNDIFDNYDKRDKDGNTVYSENERNQIRCMLEKINAICDRNFWDRFKKVLGIGS